MKIELEVQPEQARAFLTQLNQDTGLRNAFGQKLEKTRNPREAAGLVDATIVLGLISRAFTLALVRPRWEGRA